MAYPFLAITSCLVALSTLFFGLSQTSALHLREEEQSLYWPHDSSTSGGSYSGGSWRSTPNRSSYGGFSGGGPGSGK